MKYHFLTRFQISCLGLGLMVGPHSLKAMESQEETKFADANQSPSSTRARSFTCPEGQTKSPTSRKSSLPIYTGLNTILVIEDNIIIIKVIELYITSYLKNDYLYEILFSTTGEEGIKLHRQRHPILTICDYNLAGKLKGDQVLDQIRKECSVNTALRNVGVVVGISDLEENNLKMNPNHICTKPVKRAIFNAGLEAAFKHVPKLLSGNSADELLDKSKGLILIPNELSPVKEESRE